MIVYVYRTWHTKRLRHSTAAKVVGKKSGPEETWAAPSAPPHPASTASEFRKKKLRLFGAVASMAMQAFETASIASV